MLDFERALNLVTGVLTRTGKAHRDTGLKAMRLEAKIRATLPETKEQEPPKLEKTSKDSSP